MSRGREAQAEPKGEQGRKGPTLAVKARGARQGGEQEGREVRAEGGYRSVRGLRTGEAFEGPGVLAATISAQCTAAMPVSTATRGPAGGHGHSSLPRRAGLDAESRLEVVYDRIIRSSHTLGRLYCEGGMWVGRDDRASMSGEGCRGARGE